MSCVCDFKIEFKGKASDLIAKVRAMVLTYGGDFDGDEYGGSFSVPIMSSAIKVTYKISGQTAEVCITAKPFFLTCKVIEDFAKAHIPTIGAAAMDKLDELLPQADVPPQAGTWPPKTNFPFCPPTHYKPNCCTRYDTGCPVGDAQPQAQGPIGPTGWYTCTQPQHCFVPPLTIPNCPPPITATNCPPCPTQPGHPTCPPICPPQGTQIGTGPACTVGGACPPTNQATYPCCNAQAQAGIGDLTEHFPPCTMTCPPHGAQAQAGTIPQTLHSPCTHHPGCTFYPPCPTPFPKCPPQGAQAQPYTGMQTCYCITVPITFHCC